MQQTSRAHAVHQRLQLNQQLHNSRSSSRLLCDSPENHCPGSACSCRLAQSAAWQRHLHPSPACHCPEVSIRRGAGRGRRRWWPAAPCSTTTSAPGPPPRPPTPPLLSGRTSGRPCSCRLFPPGCTQCLRRGGVPSVCQLLSCCNVCPGVPAASALLHGTTSRRCAWSGCRQPLRCFQHCPSLALQEPSGHAQARMDMVQACVACFASRSRYVCCCATVWPQSLTPQRGMHSGHATADRMRAWERSLRTGLIWAAFIALTLFYLIPVSPCDFLIPTWISHHLPI